MVARPEEMERQLLSLTDKVLKLEEAQEGDQRIPIGATVFDVETSLFPPLVRAFSTANQTISDATLTAVAFASESFDSDSMHDNSSNNTRLTFNTEGIYYVEGQADFNASSTGDRLVRIRLNGSTTLNESRHPAAAGAHREMVGVLFNFSLTDYVELIVFQTSTADRTVNPARFYAFWVAPVPQGV